MDYAHLSRPIKYIYKLAMAKTAVHGTFIDEEQDKYYKCIGSQSTFPIYFLQLNLFS